MSGLRFPKEPPPGNQFPGWLVVAVLAFFLLMTIICGIDASNG